MAATTFLMIRHGVHLLGGGTIAGRSPGVHLSPLGQEQVAQAARRIGPLSVHAIYSSPVDRCQESAAILSEHLHLPVAVLPTLAEVDYGEWTRKRLEELRPLPRFQQWNVHRAGTRIPGGETMLEIQSRIIGELFRLREMHPDKTVAVVSHGDVIKAAVAYALGAPLDLLARIEISPASVTVIAWGDNQPWVLGVNSTPEVTMPYAH